MAVGLLHCPMSSCGLLYGHIVQRGVRCTCKAAPVWTHGGFAVSLLMWREGHSTILHLYLRNKLKLRL